MDHLDPANPRPMWHSLGQRPGDEDELTETIDLMDCILAIDRIGRELIEFMLKGAIASAVTPETRLYLSEAIPHQSPGSLPVIREIMRRIDDKQTEQDALEKNVAYWQKQIESLGKFRDISKKVQRAMQAELNGLRKKVETSA